MNDVKQARALATREKIIRATAGLFALKGYHDTTLEDVRGAADVTSGAFFHHFDSKEDLGFAVLDHHMERRRRQLDQIEQEMPPPRDGAPLERVFRRLDAIAEMVRQREDRKGGCIIGNFSTALSDTHDAFRRRLVECFDAMALEFKCHLDAAARKHCPQRRIDTWELARYTVSIIEGSIMLARTYRDRDVIVRNFDHLKDYLRQSLNARRIPAAGRRRKSESSNGQRIPEPV